MSYKEAIDSFGLSELYDEKDLKKVYNNLVRSYHSKENDSEINRINAMYSILLNELNKRNLKDKKKDILFNITKLKDKYKDTQIETLCKSYETKLDLIKDQKNLLELEESFNKEIYELKKTIVVPIEKEKILSSLAKYHDKYSNDVLNIIFEYENIVKNATSLEELNSTKQLYNKLLNEVLKDEKNRLKELIVRKDNLKRSQLYYFLESAKTLSIDNIINGHELLLNVLKNIDKINYQNIDIITKLLEKIQYKNIEEERKFIEFSFIEVIKRNNQDEYNITSIEAYRNNQNLGNHKLIELLLNKFYLYGTSKNISIEKIINDNDNFKELFSLIQNIDVSDYDNLFNILKKEDYKKMKYIVLAYLNFLNIDELSIERETGELCVIKGNGKKYYSVFLNGHIKNDIKTESDIKWKYMPISQFFYLADFSNGLEIEEVNEFDKILLNDYNTNYLYFTKELLFCLEDDGENVSFKFIPSEKGYDFKIGNSSQITRNEYFDYYNKKDKLLMDFLYYIAKKYNLTKNKEKKVAIK